MLSNFKIILNSAALRGKKSILYKSPVGSKNGVIEPRDFGNLSKLTKFNLIFPGRKIF